MQHASLSAVSSVKHWFSDYVRRYAASYELRDDPEVEAIAHDLGMSVWELRMLASKGTEATEAPKTDIRSS
jgi:hypothetical protein